MRVSNYMYIHTVYIYCVYIHTYIHTYIQSVSRQKKVWSCHRRCLAGHGGPQRRLPPPASDQCHLLLCTSCKLILRYGSASKASSSSSSPSPSFSFLLHHESVDSCQRNHLQGSCFHSPESKLSENVVVLSFSQWGFRICRIGWTQMKCLLYLVSLLNVLVLGFCNMQ